MMYVLEYSVYHLKPYGYNTIIKEECEHHPENKGNHSAGMENGDNKTEPVSVTSNNEQKDQDRKRTVDEYNDLNKDEINDETNGDEFDTTEDIHNADIDNVALQKPIMEKENLGELPNYGIVNIEKKHLKSSIVNDKDDHIESIVKTGSNYLKRDSLLKRTLKKNHQS